MLTSMDDLVKALASKPITPIYKGNAAAKASGSFQSLWRIAGFPTAGNIPASGNGEIPTKNTVGALNFTNAIVGKDLYLGKLGLQGSTAGTFMLYDRLWANSGLSGTVTNNVAPFDLDSSVFSWAFLLRIRYTPSVHAWAFLLPRQKTNRQSHILQLGGC